MIDHDHHDDCDDHDIIMITVMITSPHVSYSIQRLQTSFFSVDGGETIKWSRIVALYAFGGLLAVECVKNGLEDQISHIADWIYIYVRNKLSFWICRHGGWVNSQFCYDV